MKNYLEKAMTFAEYLQLIDDLLAEGKTTGLNQSEKMFNFGKLNRQRMKRLDKTVELNASLKAVAQNLEVNWIWLILTEGWCGDAAQNIPVIEKIAAENANIQTRYLLRDENLELMDQYLTNGGRAIPKMICLDAEILQEVGNWGSRPQVAQDFFLKMKAEGIEKELLMENMQRWYNSDKEQSIQAEFETILQNWSQKKRNC